LIANNKTVRKVNTEKTSCITMPRDQNSRLIKVGKLQTLENSPITLEWVQA